MTDPSPLLKAAEEEIVQLKEYIRKMTEHYVALQRVVAVLMRRSDGTIKITEEEVMAIPDGSVISEEYDATNNTKTLTLEVEKCTCGQTPHRLACPLGFKNYFVP